MGRRYDPALIEQAVFMMSRRDPALENELHEALDPLYALPNRRERDRRFAELYAGFFERLRLSAPLDQLLADFPEVTGCVDDCVIGPAHRARTQGAELFVDPKGRKTLLVLLLPEMLLNIEKITDALRRDLMHVMDMLDPAFAYNALDLPCSEPHEILIRDRYGMLWSVYVEGRLQLRFPARSSAEAVLHRRFQRVFGDHDASRRAFQHLLAAPTLSHEQLLAWSHNPARLLALGNSCPVQQVA